MEARVEQKSGMLISITSLIALILTFIIYNRFTNANLLLTEGYSDIVSNLAWLVYLMLAITLPSIAYGVYRISKHKQGYVKSIMLILKDKRYRNVAIISFIAYGLFYSFITGLIVYRPDESFSTLYNVSIPSYRLIPCCGVAGYMPMLVLYITDNFGMLIIPANLILLLIISSLVAINSAVALSIYYSNRSRNVSLAGIGASIGLFTGCPTCAGALFIALFGLSSSISAAILAPLQSLFIAASIPVLIITPILMLKRFYNASCNIK